MNIFTALISMIMISALSFHIGSKQKDLESKTQATERYKNYAVIARMTYNYSCLIAAGNNPDYKKSKAHLDEAMRVCMIKGDQLASNIYTYSSVIEQGKVVETTDDLLLEVFGLTEARNELVKAKEKEQQEQNTKSL